MTKRELVIALAEKNNLSQAKVTEMVDLVLFGIAEALLDGNEVTVRGFGTFKPVVSAPRSGRNLRTQERVVIPAKTRIKFKSYLEETEVVD